MAPRTEKSGKDQLSLFETIVSQPETEMPVCETKQVENETPHEWHMRKWTELARYQWGIVLKESVEAGDEKRQKYARDLIKSLEG